MKLRPEEITSILKQRIEQYDVETDLAEVGSVLQVGDGIARVYGLENAVSLEMLEFEHGVTGLAFNLEEDNVGTALFGAAKDAGKLAQVHEALTDFAAAMAESPELRAVLRNPQLESKAKSAILADLAGDLVELRAAAFLGE